MILIKNNFFTFKNLISGISVLLDFLYNLIIYTIFLFKTESEGPPGPTNIVVLYRGYIFSVEAFHEDQLLNPNQFCSQLQFIENWCKEQPNDGPGIGALTVNDRTTWAKNRQYLRSLSEDNAKFIDLIENSLMVVSFSDSEPVEQEEVSLN